GDDGAERHADPCRVRDADRTSLGDTDTDRDADRTSVGDADADRNADPASDGDADAHAEADGNAGIRGERIGNRSQSGRRR
ncbi:MAG: hypothetical protein IAI48_11035, partial [Candidatus Eremiobacteraeota bacterium]|nr:hypothetical protein [Candidatus Eremiobacteraeota bacterium]